MSIEKALNEAISVIRSYQLDIENSEKRPYLNINLAEKGFCQGVVYKDALNRIKRYKEEK